jgi:hypothetical protein
MRSPLLAPADLFPTGDDYIYPETAPQITLAARPPVALISGTPAPLKSSWKRCFGVVREVELKIGLSQLSGQKTLSCCELLLPFLALFDTLLLSKQ